MLTSLGRPPRRCCLAGGIMGSTIVHCSSVRSEGYAFRELPSCTIYAHSSPERICANYLPNLFLCQVIFPDSLLLIPNKRVCPPVECCLGTNPNQAANCRPLVKPPTSPTAAINAVAVRGPMPGIVNRRWLSGCVVASTWSFSS